MKCYKHNNKDAVSACNECSKALCPECTSKYHTPLCDDCILDMVTDNRNLVIKNIVVMITCFLLGYIIQPNVSDKVIFGLFFAGIPWGWSALTRITPKVFLSMPIVGWVIYLAVKLMLSMVIGIFITPFKIYQVLKKIYELKNLSDYAKV